MRNDNLNEAFTFVELLVSITIVGILFAIGYVNFREFSRRQSVESVARKIRSDLRIAQSRALSGDKPSGCDILIGYNFRVASITAYELEGVCGNGNTTTKTVDLANVGISISSPSPNPILFKAVAQGTNIPAGQTASIVVTLTQANYAITVSVTGGGEIQ